MSAGDVNKVYLVNQDGDAVGVARMKTVVQALIMIKDLN